MNPKEDLSFLVEGVEASKNWPKVEDDVIKRLSEERAFDGDIWAFKNLFKKIEVKSLRESENTISFQVELDMKKYFFAFEKRQGIWFLVEFYEVKGGRI